MEQESDLLEKERLEVEEDLLETYIYLLMLILIIYLRDQMRIYSLSFPFHLLMLPLEQQLKFQQLMVVKLK